jgi:hypothetical protein
VRVTACQGLLLHVSAGHERAVHTGRWSGDHTSVTRGCDRTAEMGLSVAKGSTTTVDQKADMAEVPGG